MTKIIDGKRISAEIKEQIKLRVNELRSQNRRVPGLAIIIVGENPASQIYVNNKLRACKEVGFFSIYYHLNKKSKNDELLALTDKLNKNPLVDGILIQLPLPKHINTENVIEAIHPNKDVDGLHPYNIGKLIQRSPALRPCTPKGIMTLLQSIINKFEDKHAVIVGTSNIVGRPMLMELLLVGSTVTTCHRFTDKLGEHLRRADIVISAVGKPCFIKGEWLKKGVVVIDAGINTLDDHRVVGDVDFENALEIASFITPVPGGVGPMTIASLLENTLFAYEFLHVR